MLHAWIRRTIWLRSGMAGGNIVMGMREGRSNKAMQLTRRGWSRVEASSSAAPRSVVTVVEPEVVRASQLIARVGLTRGGREGVRAS